MKNLETVAKACTDSPSEWLNNFRRFRYEDETFALFIVRTLQTEAVEDEDVF